MAAITLQDGIPCVTSCILGGLLHHHTVLLACVTSPSLSKQADFKPLFARRRD